MRPRIELKDYQSIRTAFVLAVPTVLRIVGSGSILHGAQDARHAVSSRICPSSLILTQHSQETSATATSSTGPVMATAATMVRKGKKLSKS